ncbi:MAG: VWA domain-containing protein [Candidatus Rokuibacteriota bacterium]|nr:MAG: VWA domain-containing protein [Candidatus Rokubacteria bacterium]
MADDLVADGDPRRALERLWHRGFRTRDGQEVPGLRDLLERLRRERQRLLEHHQLDGLLDELREALDDVLQTERSGIERRLDEARRSPSPGAAEQLRQLEEMAAQRRERLDQLPDDPGGRIRGLQDYPFMEVEAWQKFQALMLRLRQELVQSQVGGLMQAMRGMGPGEAETLRQMLGDLNRMLRERAGGGQPDFPGFMAKWGALFPGVGSLDELLDQLERRAAELESLLQSLSPEQRRELLSLQEALLADEGLRDELAELGDNLQRLAPDRGARGYRFRGQAPLSLQQALDVMGNLHDLDQLEGQVRAAEQSGQPDLVDPEALRRRLGDEAVDQLAELRRLAEKLEEAGYLERKGRRWELTPAAIRKIGQRALTEIFAALRRDRAGQHVTDRRGAGGDRTDVAKRYEFGDPFLLDLRGTLANALRRDGPGLPLRIEADDFEVYRTELSTRCATVLLLDMSRSMIYRDCWVAAKRVALALFALIRGQYPRDHLEVVGFSLYARRYAPEVLPALRISERNYGTNMQHALLLARQSLGRHRGENKQIIMITDGEPTAHLEGTEAYFDYPTTRRTWELTRAEVARCTREGIRINTFMLEDSPGLMRFVSDMARINRGRALFVTPERLGEYVLVDFLSGRQKRVG